MSDIVQRLRALSDAQPAHDDVCCALAEAADEIERLRDIISPGDAAAYEEGMAALLARCEAAEARLAEAERLLQECFDARATTPSIGLVYRVGHYLNHRNDATQEPTR